MKVDISRFIEDFLAQLQLVNSESVEKFHKTTDEPYELKEGDWVLLPRIGQGDKVLYAVLAVVYKPYNNTFFALTHGGLRILHPFDYPRKSILPAVTGPIEGCEYIMRESMVDHPPKDAYLVFTPTYLTGNRIYIGLENVLRFLLSTPGFEPHAGSLMVMQALKKSATNQ